jgi:hypothetical protein
MLTARAIRHVAGTCIDRGGHHAAWLHDRSLQRNDHRRVVGRRQEAHVSVVVALAGFWASGGRAYLIAGWPVRPDDGLEACKP